ncbi:MAG: D-lactate dehydrogenase VanH-A [Bifidobacteriaceae bacterium]|nr:D-lactate dehydrogenase VanH-A [Bifidobacteriaceae bacterium]
MPTTRIPVYGCPAREAALFHQIAPRFGVVPLITEAPVSHANIELAAGSRCVSVSHRNRVTNPMLLELSRAGARYISTRSIGYDHIDLKYARSVGLTVANVAYSPGSVADYTLMLILMAVRDARSVMGRAAARDFRLSDAPGRELGDLTVGVVGTGRIGAAVIERLRGFGCRILAHDNHRTPAADDVPFDHLLRHSDVVTFHLPLTASTRHIVNRRSIAAMKDGAFIVNTGRGSLIDTKALIGALESGRLGGAALDVIEGEEGVFYTDCRDAPRANGALARLQRLPNVIISPHVAYYTDRSLRDIVENSLANCIAFERENNHV